MKNLLQFVHKKELDPLTGQEHMPILATDIQITGTQEVPTSSGTFTLLSFTVAAGQECIIGDVDFGAAASAIAVVTVTYTNYAGTSITLSRLIYLAAAGFLNLEHDFDKRPFMAFYNPLNQNTTVTVQMNILFAAAVQYVANVAYVVRTPSA